MPLGPAQVHPEQHFGEVGRVDAARFGADVDDGVAVVVFAGQQGADFERVDVLGEVGEVALGLGHAAGVAFVGGELVEHAEVVEALAQFGDAAQFGLPVGQLAGDLLRFLRVVPEGRAGRLFLEFGDLRAQRFEVHHRLDLRQLAGQVLQGRIELIAHVGQGYGKTHDRLRTGRGPGGAQACGIESSSFSAALACAWANSATALA